nr:hypothetical protein BaRGS_013679 [Batillaria attramentaria]
MFGMISMCTLDVIMQCAFSYKDDIQIKGDSHPYVHTVHELAAFFEKRVDNPLLHYDIVYHMTERGKQWKKGCDYVHQFSEKIIEARKKDFAERFGVNLYCLLSSKRSEKEGPPQKRYLDFLDILLTAKDDSGQGMTSLDIRTEVDTFMFAEPLQIDGVTIPADTHVHISIHNLHHNPAVWSDPFTFQPERFHPDNVQNMDPYAFLPFSAGPRNCIGQSFAMNEAKIVLARLLRRFSFSLDPGHKVQKTAAMVVRAETGIKMFVTNRVPTM